MILLDTSVWVDHFRGRKISVETLLLDEQIFMHDFVLGEPALGGLGRSSNAFKALDDLPKLKTAASRDVIDAIADHGFPGAGIGYVDAHLLVAAFLQGAKIWTVDRKLQLVAQSLNIAFRPPD